MGVYLEDLTYKEILPILARTGKPIDTRKIIEIDLEKDIPTIWYNRQTKRYEPKGTKQEVYERLYKLKNGERRNDGDI